MNIVSNSETLKKLIPYFIPTCIFLGVIKLLIFYNSFDIDIVYFIGLGEVLILFLNNLWFYLLMIFLPVILFYLFFKEGSTATSNTFSDDNLKLTTGQRFKRKFKHNTFAELLLFLSFLPFTVNCIMFPNMWKYWFTFIGDYIVSFFIGEIVISQIKQRGFSVINPLHYAVAYVATHIVMLVVIVSFYEVDTVKYGKYNGTKVVIKDSTITAGPTNLYLGKTENFIFFYNPETKSPTVYKAADLVKIEYKTNSRVIIKSMFFPH